MIRTLELFSGIGGWKKALDNLGIENNTFPVEIDQDTMNIYNVINNENWLPCSVNFCKYVCPKKVDIIFMSPPCQNFSKCKKINLRIDDDLINQTFLIIKKTFPKYVIIENVPQFSESEQYKIFKQKMIDLQYYFKEAILNPIDYNWPQNRKRFYAIWFRDLKDFGNYNWPKKEKFTNILSNIINPNCYLGNSIIKDLPKEAKLINKGHAYYWGKYIDQRAYLSNSYIGAITASCNQPQLVINDNKYRTLTWKECMLLMGRTNEELGKIDKYKMFNKISDSKLKRMAGNSLVVPLIEKILKNLNFKEF